MSRDKNSTCYSAYRKISKYLRRWRRKYSKKSSEKKNWDIMYSVPIYRK